MEESINDDNRVSLIKYLKEEFNLPPTDIKTYSPLALAYIGDGIYDLVIRTMIVERGNAPVQRLHKKVSSYVKASAQTQIFHKIEEVLSEEELSVYKRGRNAKSYTSAKNATMSDYRTATGFEALMGYLYLTSQLPRMIELIKIGIDTEEA